MPADVADGGLAVAKALFGSDANGGGNEYASNIQIAELNAMNAAMAVIRWKKHYDVYRDSRQQIYTGYSIASGEVVSEALK